MNRRLLRCRRAVVAGGASILLVLGLASAGAQEAGTITPEQVQAAIDELGRLDHGVRAKAAQTIRRAPVPVAVTALLRAVDEHPDGYVRFRALVLLSGFNDPRAGEVMRRAIDDPNDRLREVGYAWFEAHPDPALVSVLLKRVDTEVAEFVRPAYVRALAALGSVKDVQQALLKDAYRGQDFFRSAVIEALGEHKAAYALAALIDIAKLDGPLRDDAVLALGGIGDVKALETLALLQRDGRREEQPVVAAAICLLGRNCDAHRGFLAETVRFSAREIGFQELLRSAAVGLAALAQRGDREALEALVEAGVPAEDPARAPLALALGRVAVRNPDLVLAMLQEAPNLEDRILLLRDAFDMLEEDFDEERFFVTVRRAYWKAPEGSPARQVANRLIAVLEF